MGKTSAADLEIISGLFLSAAEQMRRTLVRTAFNAVIYEVLDFGISIADSKVVWLQKQQELLLL